LPTPSADRTIPNRKAPLWAVLSLTFFGSLGTGAVSNGVYFVAASEYGFGHARNFALGLALGIVYIPGALLVGPSLRRLIRKNPRFATRTGLITLNIILAALCLGVAPLARAGMGVGVLWAFALIYGALVGAYWPIVESYLSGGRKDKALREATGRFNITWTLAVAISLVAMSPLIKARPLEVITLVGVAHACSLLLVMVLPREPAGHPADTPHAVPPEYRRLLAINRVLLPASYVALSALSPYWPAALNKLEVPLTWQTVLVSVWMFARTVTVLVLERWHGWHGSRAMPAVGCVTLLTGFALAIVGPEIGGTPGIAATLGALTLYGVGMAVIYAGAIYYAFEVGMESVDSGSTHEALIGVGYTVGPLLGLMAIGTEHAGLVPESGFRWVLLVLAGVGFAGAAAYAASVGRRALEP
jgi:MFS family permease